MESEAQKVARKSGAGKVSSTPRRPSPNQSSVPPGRLLPREFYQTRPEWVAPRLLGKILVHRTQQQVISGRIVEVEAYLGPHNDPPDPAAHAHRGPTPRNLVLFGLAGHAYVYSIYGRYFCLNVSCEAEGLAGCVLLRALEPLSALDTMAANRRLPPGLPRNETSFRQLTSGPSRLCQALGVARLSHNGLDVTHPESPLQIRDDGVAVQKALATPRIGISEAVDWPLRFAIPGNPCVSGPRGLNGKLISVP
ncbi:DNA-3-methyladenine glycosylase [Acidobacteria bacterium AB60]|nr:DNA-3-methyladenine glycosylase [Acidobacteria bacterium AB60]